MPAEADITSQLLAAKLEQADPAVYDILQKVSHHLSDIVRRLYNRQSYAAMDIRRKPARSISSISSPPRTSLHRLYLMP